MTQPLGITLPDPPATLYFAKREDMILWSPDCPQ